MTLTKTSKQLLCGCGEAVVKGSVFCPGCKAAIEKENARILGYENFVYQKMLPKLKLKTAN